MQPFFPACYPFLVDQDQKDVTKEIKGFSKRVNELENILTTLPEPLTDVYKTMERGLRPEKTLDPSKSYPKRHPRLPRVIKSFNGLVARIRFPSLFVTPIFPVSSSSATHGCFSVCVLLPLACCRTPSSSVSPQSVCR